MTVQHKSQDLSREFPDSNDETRLYVQLVKQRDIKSKIHSANETDLPDKGIKEQNVNKGDTTNGRGAVNKLAVDVTVVYLIYWLGVGRLGRDPRDYLTVILSDLRKRCIS